jgi:hypothetical protein
MKIAIFRDLIEAIGVIGFLIMAGYRLHKFVGKTGEKKEER